MEDLIRAVGELMTADPSVGLLLLVIYAGPMVFVAIVFYLACEKIENPLRDISDRLSRLEGYVMGDPSFMVNRKQVDHG